MTLEQVFYALGILALCWYLREFLAFIVMMIVQVACWIAYGVFIVLATIIWAPLRLFGKV